MTELTIGQQIDMEFGGKATVQAKLGSGGQSTVYIAEYNSMRWALKWFDIDKIRDPQAFRRNIKQNIKDGAPSSRYIWPKYLTKDIPGQPFGYLMALKPDSFDTLVDILNPYNLVTDPETGRKYRKRVRFQDLYALCAAVINIAGAFIQLHRTGKRYCDLSDGGFFVNIETGAVLLCDCDHIAPEGSSFGITVHPGYSAPELVLGTAQTNTQTDLYALAVVLFKLLFHGDPLEGEAVVNDVCMTEAEELVHYGQDPIFVYDPLNDTNRPVRGIHDPVIKFWRFFPDYIQEAFIYSFTAGLKHPGRRLTELDWQKRFIRLRSEIIRCVCGRTQFTSRFTKTATGYRCPVCGESFITMEFSNFDFRIPLYVGRKFYECEIYDGCEDYLEVAGELVENKLKPGMIGIKNCSPHTWRVKLPDGIYHDITPGKGFPIWKGLAIDFGGSGGVTAKL